MVRDGADVIATTGSFGECHTLLPDEFRKLFPPVNYSWRETAAKIAIRMAGCVDPGPLRPPFLEVPAEVMERQPKRVARRKALCEKYRPAAVTA